MPQKFMMRTSPSPLTGLRVEASKSSEVRPGSGIQACASPARRAWGSMPNPARLDVSTPGSSLKLSESSSDALLPDVERRSFGSPNGSEFACGNSDLSESPSSISLNPKTLEGSEKTSSVRVVVRFRPPLSDDEKKAKRGFTVRPGTSTIVSRFGPYTYDLDHVFGEDCTQAALFDDLGLPIVEDVIQGYNGTIMAYGNTGSGKTYCMLGSDFIHVEKHGIIPRVGAEMFKRIRATEDEGTEFYLKCSFLELHCEQLIDLLNPTNQNLKIKENPQKGIFVDGLTQEFAMCESDVMQALRDGAGRRTAASTQLNQHSSRSHAIFTLHCERKASDGSETLGKLNLADLAGAEKVWKSGATGLTLEEAKKINVSLLALGKVIDALVEQRPHVPYRDSRLTRILQETLGGNCKTAMVVACSSSAVHYEETLSSLRFATRAKAVQNCAKLNFIRSAEQWMMIVQDLRQQLSAAKKQIATLSPLKSLVAVRPLPEEWNMEEHASLQSNGGQETQVSPKPGTFTGTPKFFTALSNSFSITKSINDFSAMSDCDTDAPPHDDGQFSFCDDASSPNHSQGSCSPSKLGTDRWRQIAESAEDVIQELAGELMAQEQALEEIRAEKSKDGCVTAARIEGLQHAADVKRLGSRLKVAEHRAETLKAQLDLERKRSDKLEQRVRTLQAENQDFEDVERSVMQEGSTTSIQKPDVVPPPCFYVDGVCYHLVQAPNVPNLSVPNLNRTALQMPLSPAVDPSEDKLHSSHGAQVSSPVNGRCRSATHEETISKGSPEDVTLPPATNEANHGVYFSFPVPKSSQSGAAPLPLVVDDAGSTGDSQPNQNFQPQMEAQWLNRIREIVSETSLKKEHLQRQLECAQKQVSKLTSHVDTPKEQCNVLQRETQTKVLLNQVISKIDSLLDAPSSH